MRARPQVSCTWQVGDALLRLCNKTRCSREAWSAPWRTHSLGSLLALDLGEQERGSVEGGAVPPDSPQKYRGRHLRSRAGRGRSGAGNLPGYRASRRSRSHPPIPSAPSRGRPPEAWSPEPGAGSREPGAGRAPPPAARQGGVSSSAHCSPPSAAPPARSWGRGGEGAGAGADGTGVAAAAGRAAAAQTPPATQLPAAPLPPGSAPRLALPQRPRGGATGARLGTLGPPPGRRSHSQASRRGVQTLPPPGPLAKSAATCSAPAPRTRCAPRCCSRRFCCRCRWCSPVMVSDGGWAPPGLPLCRCAPGRARCWETRPASWRDPGAAPAPTTTRGHTRSPDLAPARPLPTPGERRRCRDPSVGRPDLHVGGVAMGSVRANRGAPALSGLAVLELGLGAPRASTLPLDPQRLITFFSALER